jgi:N utilization substance protein B
MSSSKRKSRELAMQVLFSWDALGEKEPAAADQIVAEGSPDDPVRRRALDMASAAWELRQTTDQWVVRLAPQWPTRRQPGVDRSLLRLAVWELTSTDTPPKVVLDEAIEMAKEFSTEQSPGFINGVLDAVLKEQQSLKSPSPAHVAESADAADAANPAPPDAAGADQTQNNDQTPNHVQ